MGITLREVIYDIGGGIRNGKRFKAVQQGGPAGGCIPSAHLDTPIDYQRITSLGAIMGSGGMIVVDEDTCMVDMAPISLILPRRNPAEMCVPCRIGTGAHVGPLSRGSAMSGAAETSASWIELAQQISEASLCVFWGRGPPTPVLTTFGYFREEYEAILNDKKVSGPAM